MFTVFKDFSFSAAHQIRGHQGGCQNLHGHNYRVRVYVRARELDGLGMVIDFADLKKIVAAAGAGMIVVSHDLAFVLGVCDRVLGVCDRVLELGAGNVE